MYPQKIYYQEQLQYASSPHPSSQNQYPPKHYPPHLQLHHQAALNASSTPQVAQQQPPLTPLDLNYSHSMIPSNLLINSPYFPSPTTMHFPGYSVVPGSPVVGHNGHMGGRNVIHHNVHNNSHSNISTINQHQDQHHQHHHIASSTISGHSNHSSFSGHRTHSIQGNNGHSLNTRSPYLTHLNNTSSSASSSNSLLNHNLDQLNLSRTIILKNLSPSLTLNDLLNEIEYGPIEYCKMFAKATPKSVLARDPNYPRETKVCYISFINSKISILFHLKYLKNAHNMASLKAKLHDSKHLKIQLNDTASLSSNGGNGILQSNGTVSAANNQDFIKLKTLNYILEYSATRCLQIRFSIKVKPEAAGISEEQRLEHIKLFINNQCLKFGDVEDFIIVLNEEDATEDKQEVTESEKIKPAEDKVAGIANGEVPVSDDATIDDQKEDNEISKVEAQDTLESASTTTAQGSRIPGSVVVHFTSIDAAIKTYESYLRRIQHDIQRLINNKEGVTKKRSSRDVNEVNVKYDIKFSNVAFHKDRCDRTVIEPQQSPESASKKRTKGLSSLNQSPNSSTISIPLTRQHIQQFNNIPEEDILLDGKKKTTHLENGIDSSSILDSSGIEGLNDPLDVSTPFNETSSLEESAAKVVINSVDDIVVGSTAITTAKSVASEPITTIDHELSHSSEALTLNPLSSSQNNRMGGNHTSTAENNLTASLIDPLSAESSVIDDPPLSISSGESPLPPLNEAAKNSNLDNDSNNSADLSAANEEYDQYEDNVSYDSYDPRMLINRSRNYTSASLLSQNSGYSPAPRYQQLPAGFMPGMVPMMAPMSGMATPVHPGMGTPVASSFQLNQMNQMNQMSQMNGQMSQMNDPFNAGNRTIYLGNLHSNTTIEEIANNVRAGGLVESINYHPEKKVCFITFVDPNVALKFYLNHQVLHQLIIHGYDVTVGWAKQHSGPVSREISLAVTAGASRNVYIGIKLVKDALSGEPQVNNSSNKPRLPHELILREDFSHFGELEQINFYHNKDCGFLNFLHIVDAIRLVEIFDSEPKSAIAKLRKQFKHENVAEVEAFYNKYKPFKISFAKDRCGNQPKFSFKKKTNGSSGSTYQQYQQQLHGNLKKRNGRKYSRDNQHEDYDEETRMNETDAFMTETINEEAAMVFGIISNSEKNEKDREESAEREESEKNEAIEKKPENEVTEEPGSSVEPLKENQIVDELDNETESDDDDVSIIIGSDDTTSTTAHNSNKEFSKKLRNNSSASNQAAANSSSHQQSQKAINGNSNPSNGNSNGRRIYKHGQSESSIGLKKSSRNSSNISLNSNYSSKYAYSQHQHQHQHQHAYKYAASSGMNSPYVGVQQQQVYYFQQPPMPQRNGNRPSPLYAPNNGYNGSFFPPQPIPIMATPQQYYQAPPQPHQHQQQRFQSVSVPSLQHKSSAYSTSGSQVMAQYLAKSQHDNLVYAANILTNDVELEDDPDYDDFVYSRRTSVSSRKSRR
ncbi:uncharacterized protein RJT20DRAFT_59290 [Scheffersomyces xylosifermentans]|uniref:uncharacterized protein n=1 Tax=Scheffersomyces xylosifermentans TaxID=1304137 RepID=UPI00315C7493